jgi:hypothetical protein
VNKTYLIVGGVSVVSLVAGTGGGYLIAKKRFDAEIETRIDEEVEKTKRHFTILLEEARVKPEEDIPEIDDEDDEDTSGEEKEELTEADQAVIEKGRKTLAEASRAMTNYQGYATKPPLEEVANNIFTADAAKRVSTKKKPLPPRDAAGHFVKQSDDEAVTNDDPSIITHEDFLLNELDYEQENLKYFVNDKTLIQVYDNESVDIGRVGEVNLTLFPDVPEGEPSIICVRNPGLGIDYEIQLTNESLTVYMGLGEDDEGLDDDEDDEDSRDEARSWAESDQYQG